MISLILIFPILACLIIFLIKNKNINNIIISLYAIIHFVCSVCLCLNFNPYDIKQNLFAVDELNKIFLIVLSVVFLAVAIYNSGYMKDEVSSHKKLRHFGYAVLLFILSMTGTILSSNLGISWVLIEATTLASAYLIYFNKTKHSIEAVWKYVFICSIGIALAFVGIILLTISTGDLNSLYFVDLYNNAKIFNMFWLKLSFVFILFGIGTKMGLVPVHFWLPDAHAQSPSPISALLSATLLNCAFFVILKVFKILIIAGCDSWARIMLYTMGFLSLFIASVFIYHINNYKRMLAYSSIENMGILAIGMALGGIGVVASIIHLIGHSLIKASFFMTSGNILKIYNTKKIKSITGLISTDKKTSWLWVLSFLGISAFPPSILFISEFLILKTMLKQHHYFMSAVFLFLLTIVLYGLLKVVFKMTVADNKEHTKAYLPITMYAPQIVLLLIAFVLGIYFPYFDTIKQALIGY